VKQLQMKSRKYWNWTNSNEHKYEEK
jgi:hypothetical protein